MSKERIIQEVTDYLSAESEGYIAGSPDAFLCVYGSSVYQAEHNDSDVDLLCAVPDTYVANIDVEELGELIQNAHIRHGHKVDQEVPYSNKLVYSFSDLRDAVTLQAFKRDALGGVIVPEILKESEFLASRQVKLRLGLNALTTPHVIISHNKLAPKRFSELAGVAMAAVGLSLHGDSRCTTSDIVAALCMSNSRASGEMFLGYKPEHDSVLMSLRTMVARSLYTLSCFGKLHVVAGEHGAYDVDAEFDAFREMEIICDTSKIEEYKL